MEFFFKGLREKLYGGTENTECVLESFSFVKANIMEE